MIRRLLLCATLVLFTACGESSGQSELVRLVDLLPNAEVDSPLVGLAAARSVSDLENVAVTEVWRNDFEGAVGLSVTGDCGPDSDAEAGSVLTCQRRGRARVSLEIEPGTGYRVRLRARRLRPLGYEVTLTEGSREGPLRIFRFPDFKGRWQPYEVWFHSTARSQRLEIAVEPQRDPGQLWLDELVVERLELTPEQELRLLKAQHNSPRRPNAVGLVKRGRLLPVDDPELVDSPRAANYTVRDAIFAPAPTDVQFDLSVPHGARLALAYAFAEHAMPGDGARVRALATGPGQEPQVLLDQELRLGADGENWHWHEWEGSLAEFGGSRVRLTLETRSLAPGRRAYLLWGSPEIYTPRRPSEPNLVVLAVDTLRADRLSCYGHTPGTTPAIDSLAEDGVRFDQAIASANWTIPSFMALFSGRGVLDLQGDLRRVPETTLVEHLREAGYATAGIAYKAVLFDTGFDRGFDSFLNAPRVNIRAEENLSSALEWLRRNRDRRFFLFLHFNDPHQPFCQPPDHLRDDLRQRLRQFGLGLPIMVSDRNASARHSQDSMNATPEKTPCRGCRDHGDLVPEFRDLAREIYDDAVRYVDGQIGLFLEALEEEELYDESVVVFISDHGEGLWGHHGMFAHARDNLFDELVRVPLIVKLPADGSWARGRVVESQVRLIDLGPTLLELGGLESSPLEGQAQSLLPALRADGAELGDRPAFSVGEKQSALSLRQGGYKYIRHLPEGLASGTAGAEELYDLAEDPAETHDVSGLRPRVLARMKRAMDELLASADVPDTRDEDAAQGPVDARQVEALRALGYIE